MKRNVILVAAIVMSAMSCCAAHPAQYDINYLGVLPGDGFSDASQINNSGQVLGQSRPSDIFNDSRGVFLWSKNTGLVNIQVEGKLDRPGGINASGQITGMGISLTGTSAYIREIDGSLLELPKPEGKIDTCGSDINDSRQVVGWLRDMTDDQNVRYYATLWDTNGDITSLGGGDELWSRAVAINSAGQVVWMREMPLLGGVQRAYLWEKTRGSIELALLDGTIWNAASCINDSGIIVGSSGDHAVVWGSDGKIVLDLGIGVACGINRNGQIVGAISHRAVLWNPDGSIAADLAMLAGPSIFSAAWDINDSGLVVGAAGYDQYQNMEAVLWEPVPVPEPSSFVALASLMTGFAAVVRRRRSD